MSRDIFDYYCRLSDRRGTGMDAFMGITRFMKFCKDFGLLSSSDLSTHGRIELIFHNVLAPRYQSEYKISNGKVIFQQRMRPSSLARCKRMWFGDFCRSLGEIYFTLNKSSNEHQQNMGNSRLYDSTITKAIENITESLLNVN